MGNIGGYYKSFMSEVMKARTREAAIGMKKNGEDNIKTWYQIG